MRYTYFACFTLDLPTCSFPTYRLRMLKVARLKKLVIFMILQLPQFSLFYSLRIKSKFHSCLIEWNLFQTRCTASYLSNTKRNKTGNQMRNRLTMLNRCRCSCGDSARKLASLQKSLYVDCIMHYGTIIACRLYGELLGLVCP